MLSSLRIAVVLAAILLGLAGPPSFAQVSKSTLQSNTATSFPDNAVGAITPAGVRSYLSTLINSYQQFTAVRAVVATTDTIGLSDYGQLVTYNNGSAVAVTLPPANGSFFPFNFYVSNLGAGAVTITPQGGSLINGASTFVVTTGLSAWVISDGTNWQVWKGFGSGAVTSGTAGQFAWYPVTAASVSGNANVIFASGILSVGQNGSTNPALQIDTSTASSATGIGIKSAAAAGGVAMNVISSGATEGLILNAKGAGGITIGNVSSGIINLAGPTTISTALTYGGVTLNNAVTGTGNMVLSNNATLVAPILGTPASGNLTNATNCSISACVSGLGTGVATALGNSVGNTGAFLVNGGTMPGVSPPQGRLTLTSGVARPTSDVAGATTLYYTPAAGSYAPVFDGVANYTPIKFSQLSNITTNSSTGNAGPAAVVANANYDLYFWSNSGVATLTRSDYWKTASTTVTITIASPAVVTWTGNTFADGTPIVFANSGGALPTGLVAGTTYFVKQTTPGVIANTFNVAATAGGSAINTSGSQSGTQSAIAGDDTGATARGIGGNCQQTIGAGLLVNTNSITNGPGAQLGTYVGTVRSDGSGTLDFTFGTTTAGGGPALLYVWNAFNQIQFNTKVGDSTASWNYTSSTPRAMDNSNSNRVSFISGLAVWPIFVNRSGTVNTVSASNAFGKIGFALNSINTFDRYTTFLTTTVASQNLVQSLAGYEPAQLGSGFIQAIESSDGTNNNAFAGSPSGFLEVTAWQ